MATELPKQFDPKEAQPKWLAFWAERGYGHSRPDQREPYTIVIPPPNVTGALHMGHALNNTLQDVLIRWRRMQGYNAEWMPGTDHAGIATQAVVEKLIFATEKKTRHDLGREELVKRIWQWKDKYEARILGQLRELGCSCDWQRTRFTFDEGNNRAVRTTFFNWFKNGFIFRGKRLVNWDTQLQTSVADDETYTEETKSGFWTFKYPVKDSPNEFIRFSTTRPETMLGDTAVAVHPSDERYKHLIGKTVTIPLTGREIPIIADGLLAKPELGTGCVKVTPAHDHNDYACGVRHKLPMINILNPDGTINENGGKYAGMDRSKARESVTADMEAMGYFEGREDRMIPLAYSDRSKTPIEPYLSDQWFVKMGDTDDGKPGLARRAMEAVMDGRVKFYPERYAQTYLDWLSEKRDWCISRQLWWGHRIPVWNRPKFEGESWTQAAVHAYMHKWVVLPAFDNDEHRARKAMEDIHCEYSADHLHLCIKNPEVEAAIGETLGKMGYTRDPDVLDTWFSSQLWPYSTFGWPEQTPELKYYYPTSTLVTSRDIITLWVARMVLSGLYNMGDVPFRHVYITPKLLDGFGETMSKSKGNGVDPLDIIERYGTDALRFQMVFIAGDTQDSRLPVANVCPHCDELVPMKQEHMSMRTRKVTCPKCKKAFRPGGPWPSDDPDLPTAKQASEKFEMGRNFANKLWNATRMVLLNLDGYRPEAIRFDQLPTEDRWILSRLAAVARQVTEQLEGYRFSDVARTLYDFTWSEFCDWYLEMSKGRLKGEPGASATGDRARAQRVLVGVIDGILRLIHPVMPFVSESLWQALNEAAFERGLPNPDPAADSVMIAAWPTFPADWQDAAVEGRIARMQDLVRGVREIKNQYMVEDRTKVDVFVRCSEELAADFRSLHPFIAQLAGVGALTCGPTTAKPPQAASKVLPGVDLYVSLAGLIDRDKEKGRLEKQLADKRKQRDAKAAKLANESFVARAPAEVVQQERDAIAALEREIATIEENLRDLTAG
jgi:valyl-tRNA synthetase